ncbi:hypothetical protein VP01_844g2 [Puccinia sorghi]|uniref:Uncharacterized protein n=1 Tax=Puccinia sorghi TaxID=27349 RepID=A0A0L6U9Z7_9BASI|nr:hypothetical protein VP01_844g2 [Puccinia sorghi]
MEGSVPWHPVTLLRIHTHYQKAFHPHKPPHTGIKNLNQCFNWREDLCFELRMQIAAIRKGTSTSTNPLLSYPSHVKCIYPDSCHHQSTQDLLVVIPANLKLNSHVLMRVDITELEKTYLEILMEDETHLAEACKYSVLSDGVKIKNLFPTYGTSKPMERFYVTCQLNTHISFFFKFTGLPPQMSNQEYNFHFFSTSKVASCLELAEPIVEYIK